MHIPFNKPTLTGKELGYIRDAVLGGKLSGDGRYSRRCQELMQAKFSARKVLLTTSCTDAMELAALLLDLKPGDEVIMPSYTFTSTANAFALRGARPVFIDIRPDTKNIDEEQIERKLGPRTRAVVAVHYAGVSCEMDKINEIARRRGLAVIEDAAQGINARYKGRPLGALGTFGCYSFHDTKNLTCGEGGALVINEERFIERAEILREKGTDRARFARGEVQKYTWQDVGSSFLPSELLAAFLLAQLEHMDEVNAARQRLCRRYERAFADLAEQGLIELPVIPPDRESNHHMFYVLLPDQAQRDGLIGHLKEKDIIAIFHYVPLHSSPMGLRLGYEPADLPVTENISLRLVRLPLYNDMTEEEQSEVIAQVRGYLLGRRRQALAREAPAAEPRYGFYGRLKAAFPSQIIVDATEICNLACIHCPHPDFKKSEHYQGRHLDMDLHRKMVDEVREHGAGLTQYIRYTSNGEPLVHPGIYDMLDDAVRRSGVFVALTTNGTILDEKRIEKLLACGLHLVDVSIDAHTPETYSRVRVGGRFEVTKSNVLRLIELKRQARAATRVVASFVEQPENRHESAAFEAFWKDHGADFVVIRRLHSAAGGVPSIAARMKAEDPEPRRPCLYPWERILLNPQGKLAFCPQDWTHGSVVADYRQTTIAQAWRGAFYDSLRRAHLSDDFSAQPFCGQCPDWRQTCWPGEGRSYADLVAECSAEG